MAGETAREAAVYRTKRSTAQRQAARRWAAQSREKLVWRLTVRAQAAEQAEGAMRTSPEVTRRLQAVAPVLAAAVSGKPVPAGSHLIRNVALHAKHLPLPASRPPPARPYPVICLIDFLLRITARF